MRLDVFGPLEQFEITPLFHIYLDFIDLSISKGVVVFLLALFLFFSGSFGLFLPKNSPRVFKMVWQYFLEIFVKVTSSLAFDNIGKEGERFSPFIFSLFLFIALSNVIGLIPYSFALTSHLIFTFSIALFLFIGANFVGVEKHGSNLFCLFLPGGTSIALALLLVPIEIVSYIFKPISLSVRLFANVMAGHTLTHVIGGFAWSMFSVGGFFFVLHVVPLIVLFVLMGLEFAVALIQAYVFAVLSCIYLNDVLHLH